MAIVHFAMKSEAQAPPAAMHADYIMRAGKYERMDRVHVEWGNLPEFAQDDPRVFWQAADQYERANGRTYTELQIALPRELDEERRTNSLAKWTAFPPGLKRPRSRGAVFLALGAYIVNEWAGRENHRDCHL